MINLEEKIYMSPTQLGIVIFVTCVGAQIMLTPLGLIDKVGQASWMSVLIGGVLFCSATLLMLKLGTRYPDKTLVEYMPKLWGKFGGRVVIWWFNLLLFLTVVQIFYGIGKVITFYMFDRTPPEVIILAMLVVCTYCALQDWGTILRIQQITCFTAYSTLYMIWMMSILNFNPMNMLPLWPVDIKKVISGSFDTWGMYSGYELVLLLLPLVNRNASFKQLAKVTSITFLIMCILFLSVIVVTIGVLTVETAKNSPHPAVMVIRSVELPGTFVERLENYLLLAWVPIVFDTLAAMQFFMAEVLMRQHGLSDHRPYVLLLVPIVYMSSIFLDSQQVYDTVSKFITWAGLGFSFGVIPLSLILSWKKRGQAAGIEKSCKVRVGGNNG